MNRITKLRLLTTNQHKIIKISIQAIILLIAIFSLGNNRVVAANFCPQGREISNTSEHFCLLEQAGKEVKHGPYEQFFPSGQIQKRGKYLYNQPTGLWITWDENGKKIREENFNQGRQHGWTTYWHPSGKKAFAGEWRNGQPIGQHHAWNPQGEKVEERLHYVKDDALMIDETHWYSGGAVALSVHYKNNKLHGKEVRWYKNGQKQSVKNYTIGSLDGPAVEWYASGQKQAAYHYKNGTKEGKATTWYSNGQKQSEGLYDNGKHGVWTIWNENGSIYSVTTYNHGNIVPAVNPPTKKP